MGKVELISNFMAQIATNQVIRAARKALDAQDPEVMAFLRDLTTVINSKEYRGREHERAELWAALRNGRR
jgi:hypothetical protein